MSAFNRLNNRYIITGTLAFDSAVHIGSGEGDERADAIFVRSNSKFYVPGSSMRGAMRSAIERITATLVVGTAQNQKMPCFLDSKGESTCFSVNENAPKDIEEWRDQQLSENQIFKSIYDSLCPICRLFGSPYFASKIKVMDGLPKTTLPQEGPIRTGIGIDRDTESVRQGVLFEVEVLDSEPQFSFKIIAENLNLNDPWDWGLLALALLELKQGNINLGAKSATGMGNCILEGLKIEGFETAAELKTYLTSRTYEPKQSENSYQKFLENKLTDLLAVLIPQTQPQADDSNNENGEEM